MDCVRQRIATSENVEPVTRTACVAWRRTPNSAAAATWDPNATLADLREAVTMLEPAQRTARRVFGGQNPLTQGIELALRAARAALRARETPPPAEPVALPDEAPVSPSLADVVSQFGEAVSDGRFRATVPDPEPDEGAVNPWLADQISKLAVSRDYRA